MAEPKPIHHAPVPGYTTGRGERLTYADRLARIAPGSGLDPADWTVADQAVACLEAQQDAAAQALLVAVERGDVAAKALYDRVKDRLPVTRAVVTTRRTQLEPGVSLVVRDIDGGEI